MNAPTACNELAMPICMQQGPGYSFFPAPGVKVLVQDHCLMSDYILSIPCRFIMTLLVTSFVDTCRSCPPVVIRIYIWEIYISVSSIGRSSVSLSFSPTRCLHRLDRLKAKPTQTDLTSCQATYVRCGGEGGVWWREPFPSRVH
jgi:hypothetical protein